LALRNAFNEQFAADVTHERQQQQKNTNTVEHELAHDVSALALVALDLAPIIQTHTHPGNLLAFQSPINGRPKNNGNAMPKVPVGEWTPADWSN